MISNVSDVIKACRIYLYFHQPEFADEDFYVEIAVHGDEPEDCKVTVIDHVGITYDVSEFNPDHVKLPVVRMMIDSLEHVASIREIVHWYSESSDFNLEIESATSYTEKDLAASRLAYWRSQMYQIESRISNIKEEYDIKEESK